MAGKVVIISKEIIKPSWPTPRTHRTHKLSLFDQTSPPVFMPLILFYQYDRAQKLQSLKQSLSHALTQFYPLAGRCNNNNYIDCNDAGVEFIEARVLQGCTLSRVTETPEMEELKEFFPVEICGTENHHVLAIQVNLFDCGGIAIALCMSHKVGDGASMFIFLNSWAAISRGGTDDSKPNFNVASLVFPPMYLLRFINPTFGITDKKLVTKRFVFDKEKLDALKKSASVGSRVEDPTRVEALSAFLWKHFIEASKRKKGSKKKMFAAFHAVDMRSRMKPTLSGNSFGNLWATAGALSKQGSDDDLLYQLRNAITEINGDSITKRVKNVVELSKHVGKLAKLYLLMGRIEYCSFSNCCKFPVYEVDFGWGKPVWACIATLPYKNFVIFVSTKCGEGIEAWVNMPEDDNFLDPALDGESQCGPLYHTKILSSL